MHLLQSGVDLNMIRSWLGHASIETTNGYVEIDLENEGKTLESVEKLLPKTETKPFMEAGSERLGMVIEPIVM